MYHRRKWDGSEASLALWPLQLSLRGLRLVCYLQIRHTQLQVCCGRIAVIATASRGGELGPEARRGGALCMEVGIKLLRRAAEGLHDGRRLQRSESCYQPTGQLRNLCRRDALVSIA